MKVCSKCGEEKLGFCKRKNRAIEVYCKGCAVKRATNYNKNNPSKFWSSIKKYRQKDGKHREYNRGLGRQNAEKLNDSYLKKVLNNEGFSLDIITKELIETKRLILKIKRKCNSQKTSKNSATTSLGFTETSKTKRSDSISPKKKRMSLAK